MSSAPSPDPAFVQGIRTYVHRPLGGLVAGVENAALVICSGAILLAMMLTTIDVVLRYGFRSPLGWSFDVIMLYLLPAAYYLGFSYGMKAGVHLAVDFFTELLPSVARRVLNPLALVAGAFLSGYVAWLIGTEAWHGLQRWDVLFGSIPWPTWPTGMIIAFSFVVFAVRLVLTAFQIAFPEG